MKTSSAIGRASILAAMLLGAGNAANALDPAGAATAVQKSFDKFADRLAADWMRANPVAATAQQYFQGEEQDALDRELTAVDAQFGMPLDAPALAAYVARARGGIQQLKKFRRTQLTPTQRVSAASLQWQLGDVVRTAAVADQRFVFDQFRGQHVALVNFLSQLHPMRTRRDVDNYLARLNRVAPVLDEGIEVARARPEYEVLEMRTLMHHEGVPGHHFQIALQQESMEIPVFRRKRVFGRLVRNSR